MIKSKQNGFTLIELVVVIVILGILAAFAVPRFMGMEGEARASTIKSMGGSLLAAATMARAKCQAQGCGNGPLQLEGAFTATMVNGYPNNATIRNALQTTEGFAVSAGGNRFTKLGAAGLNCWVQYNQAAANAAPTLTYAPVVNAGGLPGTPGFNQALSNACR